MAKAKFDSAKMKKSLAEHGEKIGFGAAFVLMAWLLYSAMQVQPYKQKPEQDQATVPTDLKNAVGAVRAFIEGPNNKVNLQADGVTLPGEEPIKVIDRLLVKDVAPALFAGIEWNKPLFDTKQRRREPQYLALRDLRASFYNAAVNIKLAGAPADGRKELALGKEWLCVTGIVPLEEQTAEYTKAFQNALDTQTNASPSYGIYQLQRAEVDPSNPDATPVWGEALDLSSFITEEIAKWAGTGPEYVEAGYVRDPLTQPLPILTNGDYGDWAAHAPEIPRAGVAAGVPPPAAAAAPAAVAPGAGGGLFGGAGQPAPAAAPALVGGVPAPAKPGEAGSAKAAPQYLLFRFLDFKIEPRKTYRYRVKLVLANPNFNLDKAHLDKPEFAVGETRETIWSDPSPPITIPVLESYFGGGVLPVSGDFEPAVNVGVKKWYPPLASDIYYEFEKKYRGTVLNDAAAKVAYTIPGDKKGDKKDASVETDALLADFSWEKKESQLRGPAASGGIDAKACNRPSEILVCTPRGEMVILTELGDLNVREEKKTIEAGGSVAPGPAPGPVPATGPAPVGGPTPSGTPPAAAPSGTKKPSIFDLK